MQFQGFLVPLKTSINDKNQEVQYSLDHECLNQWIGHWISLEFLGRFQCFACEKVQTSLYRQGLCKQCFYQSPWGSPCIIFPEKCRAHHEKGRDIDWEKKYHLTPQVVYLACNHDVKVGVTQDQRKQHRWMEQGAKLAVVIAKTANRYEAGCIEYFLKSHFKSNIYWKYKLLSGNDAMHYEQFENQLKHARSSIQNILDQNKPIGTLLGESGIKFLKDKGVMSEKIHRFYYPFCQKVSRIQSLKIAQPFQKYQGKLIGITGQYFMFDDGYVWNLKAHQGFEITIKAI